MKILGLDPSSTQTGWGLIEIAGIPDFVGDSEPTTCHCEIVKYGVIECQDKNIIPRLRCLDVGLDQIYSFIRHRFGHYVGLRVCVETPFVHPSASKQTAIMLGKVLGLCELKAYDYVSLENIHEYSPKHIKKTVAGNGNSSKEEVREAVKKWVDIPDDVDLNISDAIACALTYIIGGG